MRALVIDDNPTNLSLTSEILKTLGFDVTTSAAPFDALRLIGESHFPLILMDYYMEPISGAETIRIIRAMESDKNEKGSTIIAISGSRTPEIVWNFLSSGANHFLNIPLTVDQVKECLIEVGLADFLSPNDLLSVGQMRDTDER